MGGVSSVLACGLFVLFVLFRQVNGDGRRNGATWIGARDGRGAIGGDMGGDMGQGGGACSFRSLYGAGRGVCCGAGVLAFASKLCNCVIYDKLPQYFAATSFRYLFGVKCCYFVI